MGKIIRNKAKGKPTPIWFLILVICLIIYGTVSILLFNYKDINTWIVVSKINVLVTLVWLIFNIIMFYIFSSRGYEKEAIIFSGYYVVINVLNVFNLYFGWIPAYETVRNISICTKIIELSAVAYIFLHRSRD